MAAAVDSFILFALQTRDVRCCKFYLSNRYVTLSGPEKMQDGNVHTYPHAKALLSLLIYNDDYCTVAIPWSSLKTFPLPFFHGT